MVYSGKADQLSIDMKQAYSHDMESYIHFMHDYQAITRDFMALIRHGIIAALRCGSLHAYTSLHAPILP